MVKFDLSTYGVEEMTQKELVKVEGGNVFKKAWKWCKEHVTFGGITGGATFG